jgi:hypothetical protein
VAAVRAGAVNLVEELVLLERAEAYNGGAASEHDRTVTIKQNRNQWRSFAYETKDKLVELSGRVARVRVETENVKTWTHNTDAWDEGWRDAMTIVGQILDGLEDDDIGVDL